MKKFFTWFGWPLLIVPTVLTWMGIACNAIVTIANGGIMPVRYPGCTADLMNGPHVCMTTTSHIKFLADVFTSNAGIMSVGDYLMEFSDDIRFPLMVLWATAMLAYALKTLKPTSNGSHAL